MYTISTNRSSKSIIKHIKYKLNEQQYIDMDMDALRVVKLWTREAPPPERDGLFNICQYDAVNAFGKEVQEGPPPLPPKLWRYGRPVRCRVLNLRRPTSCRGSAGTMKIVALNVSTSDRRVFPLTSLFTVCDDNVTEKVHSTIQQKMRGGRITVYQGAASSSGPKWQSRGNTIPPTVDSVKYGITSCGLQIKKIS